MSKREHDGSIAGGYAKRPRVDEGPFIPAIRGALSKDEDLSVLKDGVPLFTNKAEAIAWCRQLSSEPGSVRPNLKHSITTFVGWEEVSIFLIPRIIALNYPACPRPSKLSVSVNSERFQAFPALMEQITSRLSLMHHRKLSPVATLNTLRYAFFHMRCGILVQIRNNEIKTFAPFVNDEYRNTWGGSLKTDPSPISRYYQEKRRYCREENILPDPQTWWANGNIICNEHDSTKNGNETTTHWWGDNMLLPFKHMLEQVCLSREVPDVDFFFNKRDHPQLRTDPTLEPYDFLFDERNTKIPVDRRHEVMAPFVSFYCSPAFSDLAVPTVEDWKGAVGIVFPESTIPQNYEPFDIPEPSDLYLEENLKKFYVPWENKIPTAFFRGNATGGGVTPETNQRLHLSKLSAIWRKEMPQTPPLLDAGVTGWNVRDKKLFGEPMRYIRRDKFNDLKAARVPMYEQSKFKYIVYVEGHCAANRYAFLMLLGSVILRVDSQCTASELWFFPMLKGQDTSRDFGPEEATEADHVLVSKDLRDLKEKIDWCRRNDALCQKIAENARKTHDQYVSKEAILDYWQILLGEIGKRTVQVPSWWTPSNREVFRVNDKPHINPNSRFCDPRSKDLCMRCKETSKTM